jgi:ankyrin repeat protein
MNRRTFLAHGLTATAVLGTGVLTPVSAQSTSAPPAAPAKPLAPEPPKPPPLPADKVKAIVSHAHRSLEEVKKLVTEDPLLVNASWDWGGGDFETPLQSAAHTGRREIAEFLLSQNARPDLFAAAMLGQLDIIKAALSSNPATASIPGPHGFTLLHCAKQGGASAKAVYDYLIAQGTPEIFKRPLPFTLPPAPSA